MKIIRTNSENQDFINLVKKLDAYLKITDGDEHDFYNQFNNIDVLKHVVLVYLDGIPVGCGAIKKMDESAAEVKRMFVSSDKRGKGIAQKILTELEVWAKELNYKKCVLETGKRQVEAVSFYHKCKYKVIPNYGQYAVMENSICFEKEL
ncbi:N-acetyltransferase [Polaribacter reichenbachii]|uniref:GNAT family acetyltransferase n=1 Tax=Polaribacter reichenbachii TaxID=996801 RepID=A0A1B8TUS5_9FLAO|nr:GNAT family N-acetyltransferase [Polaribacter reichenbachii]APZ45736.1 N-acetyltransferase [Polaribacter reichenbachii]AUC19597.1 N-acetyltransferase [Polaribacter reichenbachii]OBY63249.1 GNAT family acetyltransferase [Polaribacter reichenbachii]